MDFDQLKYISELTRTTSINNVADHYFTSYPVVKRAITNLENELQVTLLQSTNQGTTLTPAGHHVAKFAQSLQEQYLTLKDELQEFSSSSTQQKVTLHLYVTPSLATEYYLDLYDSFFQDYPVIKLITHSSTLLSMLEDSFNTENSIYFTPLYATESNKKLFNTLTKKYQLKKYIFKPSTNYICMHKSSKYTKLIHPTLSDLKDATIYSFLNTNPLLQSDEQGHISYDSQYFSDFSLLKRNLRKQQAIGILKKHEYDYYFGENNKEFILYPLKELSVQHAILVSEKTLTSQPIIHEFIAFLKKIMQQ